MKISKSYIEEFYSRPTHLWYKSFICSNNVYRYIAELRFSGYLTRASLETFHDLVSALLLRHFMTASNAIVSFLLTILYETSFQYCHFQCPNKLRCRTAIIILSYYPRYNFTKSTPQGSDSQLYTSHSNIKYLLLFLPCV